MDSLEVSSGAPERKIRPDVTVEAGFQRPRRTKLAPLTARSTFPKVREKRYFALVWFARGSRNVMRTRRGALREYSYFMNRVHVPSADTRGGTSGECKSRVQKKKEKRNASERSGIPRYAVDMPGVA